VVHPINSALQTGFSKLSQIGSTNSDNKAAASHWVSAMDFGRQAQQISNLGPDRGPRVPAPTDVGPTTRLNEAATRGANGATSPTMGKPTNKL
jgi:hypothetical protein